jgi:hypothetical protein
VAAAASAAFGVAMRTRLTEGRGEGAVERLRGAAPHPSPLPYEGRGGAWLLLPLLLACTKDPAAGFLQTKQQARNYDCQRLAQQEAHERYPGLVPEPPPRGGYGVKDALICSRRIVDWGDRDGRDEVVLSSLRASVDELVRLASSAAPEGTTWYVDAFYPQPQVAQKISTAARVTLVERGHVVSDQVPVLAAGDIAVLARLGPSRSYALACKRYFAQGILHHDEALLGLMVIDARETQLHAGVCLDGEWRWLQ